MDEITAKNLKDYPRMVRWFDPWLLLKLLLKVIVADIFGQYADRRLIHAALDKVEDKELVDRADVTADVRPDAEGAIWIDYISDLGDGFDATYAMAYLLAQEKVVVDGISLPRGRALVMGGDEVYPTAERQNYNKKMRDPYKFAFPNRTDGPHPLVFMIPGNHDWYDGLTLFLALFCRKKSSSLGSWRTRQRRSYFALKLAPNWWLWAIDIQLGADMDQPQADYFNAIAAAMPDKANVILCSAEPGWYGAEANAESFRVLSYAAWIAENAKKDIKVALALSGDTHHYSRYSSASGIQFITSGGGGAFLHGTLSLKSEITAEWLRELKAKLSLQALYPSKKTSRKLLWGNFLFPFWNWDFSLVLGGLYWLFCFALFARPELDTKIITALVLVGGFGGYFAYQGRKGDRGRAFLLSLPHVALHFAAMICLAGMFSALNANFGLTPFSWAAFGSVGLIAVPFGWLVGGVIFGINLFWTARFADLNHNDAFSALRLDSHRHFLRIKIKGDTLTIYPIGLEHPPRRGDWKDNPNARTDPVGSKFVSATPLEVHLIETPIVVDARLVAPAAQAAIPKSPIEDSKKGP